MDVVTLESQPSQGESEADGEDLTAISPDPSSIRLSHGRRLDFVLPMSAIEAANEYLSSISAHACYLGSPEVALFLLRILRGKLD